jgi:tetratricopeptide (TPR) repeat protein
MLAASCFAVTSPLVRAQISSWPLDGPAFSTTPAQVVAAANAIPTEKDTDVTVLFDEDRYAIDASGSVTHTTHFIYRLETAAGVNNWSDVSVEWETFYQNEPAIHARVIPPGGQAVELDQKTITDVAARETGDGTLSDDRLHKAPLPALSIGAIVEEETVSTDKESYFAAGGVYRNYFQRRVPVTRSRLIVEVPAATPLNYRVRFLPDVVVKDETQAQTRRLTFDQGRLPAWVDADISLPTRQPRWPVVEFATGKSWQDVASAYAAVAEPQIHPEQVKLLLPPSGSDRLATISALVASLHKQVRYTGVEFGKARLQPQTAKEVLTRHYGDCKDKAALLVAMLRAAGIEAHLALLDAGPGEDVTADLPGVNGFDHAIVYVPAAAGNPALWIDATAEFTRVGDLPYGDHGRRALIIADGTRDLTLTPEARPEDSLLTETREFDLADYGPAHVVESSETTGYVDANFRSWYGGPENKDLRNSLENYVKRAYNAKALTSIDHSDAKDFAKPFVLRLDIAKAIRGNTLIGDAAVGLDPRGTWNTLPEWFSVDPDKNEKLTAEQQADRAKAQSQRSEEYDIEPFIIERRYRIVSPAGFAVRSLPPNQVTPMGPGSLSQNFAVDSSGVVTATYRFSTGKSRYTQDDALALRKALVAANKADTPVVTFDQAGAKLLAAGKVREALAADRDLIGAHPKDAAQHVRMAYALLQGGVGDQAQAEARQATQLDPKSALAWSSLGWTLQHNAIGIYHGKGFDLDASIAGYLKAIELDPDDLETRENLAILYEYDANGTRYVSQPGLNHAIDEYKALKAQDKAAGEQLEDNLLYCLLYAHRYADLKAELAPLPVTSARNSLGIAAAVAAEGVPAGLKRADRVSGNSQERSTALNNAGQQLIRLRMYPEAAQILSAGMQNQEQAAQAARQIAIFTNLHPYDPKQSTPVDATTVVRQMLAGMTTGEFTDADIARVLTRHSFATEDQWQRNTRRTREAASTAVFVAAREGLTPDIIADVSLGSMKMTVQGDDPSGYRVTMQTVGTAPQQFFVTKEDGAFKIVASQSDMMEVGNEALYLLHHGDERQARSLLDWKRDLIHKGGGDDPLLGPLFPLFWTSGESKGADAIERAAASLMVGPMDISAMLPSIAAKAAAATGADKPDPTSINLLLAYGYIRAEKASELKAPADALLAAYPDSNTAIRLAGEYDRLTRNWTAWNALLDKNLAKHPTSRELLLMKAEVAQAQGDWASARHTLRSVLDGGEAVGVDFNNYAWNALFQNKVDDEAIQAGQQSTTLSKNSQFSDLHTLACLYAALGRTTEARQLLIQAMNAANLAEPNSASWFVIGAIDEQYGANDAAIAAYKRVEKPEGPINPVDTWVLAQSHLKGLHAL